MRERLSAYYLLFFMAAGSSGPFLTLLLHHRGLTASRIGLILAAGALAGTLVQPLIGHLNDIIGRPRLFLFISALASPMLFWGYAFARGFAWFILISVVSTIVQGAFPIADAIAINQSRQTQPRSFTYGQVRLWGALGYALMVAGAGWVYHRDGLMLAVWVYAALTMPVLAAIVLLPGKVSTDDELSRPRSKAWDLLGHKTLMAFIAISFVITIAITINASFLPLYYARLGYPMGWVGLNFTVAAAVEIPFFQLSGRVIAKLGTMNTVLVGTACYALKYLVMALTPGAVIVIAVQALDGVAYALFWSASVDVVNTLAPRDRKSSGQTLYGALAGNLSAIVAQAVGGWLLGRFGPHILYASMTISTGLMLIPLMLLAKKTAMTPRPLPD